MKEEDRLGDRPNGSVAFTLPVEHVDRGAKSRHKEQQADDGRGDGLYSALVRVIRAAEVHGEDAQHIVQERHQRDDDNCDRVPHEQPVLGH